MQELHALEEHVQYRLALVVGPAVHFSFGSCFERFNPAAGVALAQVLLVEPQGLVRVETGTGFDHTLQVKRRDGLLQRVQFFVIPAAPAQQQEHVEEGFGQIPLLAVADGGVARGRVIPFQRENGEAPFVAVALAELSVSSGFEDERQVRKFGCVPAKRLVEQDV